MSDVIEWVLELEVSAGQADGMADLLEEMVAATKANEPGALHYEYYISDDGTRVTSLERYADNAAAMTHLANFGAQFAERFLATFAPLRFSVFGPAGADLRAGVAAFGAEHMAFHKGFARG
ncbi:antibiotic biosynthesis monooxygenase [Sulfitobacter sp. HNIBRBA3233]|uniref:putative quinol monooxygenase n=1 Tax=Sulfitobacter marinivivus TaxID=3158558 RepID=UPI0032E01243